MNDILINKSEIIERCIRRILEEYDGDPANLTNFTKQDSIILNIQRACEAAIDLAMHVVSVKKLGVPQHSRDAFDILFHNHVISKEIRDKLVAMVGFRNIAVHNYQQVDIGIIQQIIEKHLQDFKVFKTEILKMQL